MNKLKSDERLRNNIEGKFGQAKRGFNLEKVMAKLPEISATAIAITFLVINISTLLKEAFSLFLYFFGEKTIFAFCLIILNYG
ncbi:MAG: transposase [Okeania sp. SIO2F4]|nr:transposase [Okeania sp. SIO2F4]